MSGTHGDCCRAAGLDSELASDAFGSRPANDSQEHGRPVTLSRQPNAWVSRYDSCASDVDAYSLSRRRTRRGSAIGNDRVVVRLSASAARHQPAKYGLGMRAENEDKAAPGQLVVRFVREGTRSPQEKS